ncbi:hypothetical protein QTP88_015009 [Uroleucon formosanum]
MVEQKAKLIELKKAETSNVKWDTYIQYIKSIGPIFCIASVLLHFLFQGFSISSNIWLLIWSNDYSLLTGETENYSNRFMFLTVYGLLGLGQIFSMVASSLTLSLGTILGGEKLYELTNSRIFRNPKSLFDTTPIGRILNRVTQDIDIIDNSLPSSISSFIQTTVSRFYVATSRQLKRLKSISRFPIYSNFGETIAGATSIRAYSAEFKFSLQSQEILDFNHSCYYPSIVANRWMALRVETIGNFIIFFASLFAVLGRDKLSPGIVGLCIQITQALNLLVRLTSDVETNIVAVERIKEYGETPQEAAWEVPSTQPPKEWPTRGEVQFKNLKVRYREGLDLVLKGLDLIVEGGQKVGIVGHTGAGKSSLTLSLFRIVEAAEGSILIDGVDISKIGLHTLRNRLTIIPQAILFSGTLRMNLDPTNSNTDAQLWSALTLAHLKEYVVGLAGGLDYEVSEGGENLSVGQRQLVRLARVLLKKTKILVLNEATASIDLETDEFIQATLRSKFKDCTILTIAHRLNTIMDSDKYLS